MTAESGSQRPGPAARSGRRVRDVLRHRDFLLFLAGKAASDTGTRAANVAVPLLLVTRLHATPFDLGLAVALQFAPSVLAGLPGGALLDRARGHLRGVLIACDVAGTILFGWLAAAAWLGLLTIAQVMVIALLAGTASVISETGKQAWLPRLLGGPGLAEANTVLQVSENSAALGGPGLGGVLAQAAGAASALAANAGSFAASAACLAFVGQRETSPGPAPGPKHGPGEVLARIRSDTGEGIRFVFRDPWLRPLLLWAGCFNFGFAGYMTLLVPYLLQVARVSPAVTGVLAASGWAGAILGALAAPGAGRRFGTARVCLASGFLAVPALLIPLPSGGAARVAFFAGGTLAFFFGLGMSNVITGVFRQAYPPEDMVARVTSVSWSLADGVYPPGALLAGTLATGLGVRAGLWIMLGFMAAAGLFLLPFLLRGHRDLPASTQPSGTAAGWADPPVS